MSKDESLSAIVDALDAISTSIYELARVVEGSTNKPEAVAQPKVDTKTNAVVRARQIHPELGPRQAEILKELEGVGAAGTSTGPISNKIGYAQPNVYLTLKVLTTLGLVEKDELVTPHRYRLASSLRD